MNDVFHYPPDLFDLIVQTIPLLNRSKESVLIFFKGAGVDKSIYSDISIQVKLHKESINKYAICRKILERINENSEKYLRERREIIKRIIEFEAFSTCWENDQFKAKGLVAEIRNIVNVKDSFTRMKQERDREKELQKKEYDNKMNEIHERRKVLENIKKEFFSLFSETNFQKRGKQLEKVLNDYFKYYGILIKDDFKRIGEPGDGIIEQIDGVVEIDNQIYLVEIKWKKDAIGNNDIFTHLGRIYHRTNACGFFISASGYTPAALSAAKEAFVKNALLVFFNLEEFVKVIEKETDFKQYSRKKIEAAILKKDPYFLPEL